MLPADPPDELKRGWSERLRYAVDSERVDAEMTAEEWWQKNEAAWRQNPAYFENRRSKAERHGVEWVRANKRVIDAYCDNAAALLAAKDHIEKHGSLDDW
jgi:hypothetical protein